MALIVFEGTDGSGKSTQFARLCQRLEREGQEFRKLVFPQYDKPSSALLRMYLQGEFGSRPEDVNPYAASSFYAVDRYASWKQVWGEDYRRGALILADRYTTSNAVHQASKMPRSEREGFFRWLGDFEYDKLGLPRPDRVVWLDMPIDRAVENLRRREADTNTHADIHEVDGEYLRVCHTAAAAAAEYYGWARVSCVDASGSLRSVEDIHEEIWGLLAPLVEKKEG